MDGGHYTCIVSIDDKKFLANDEKIDLLNSGKEKESAMIFYEKEKEEEKVFLS